MSKAPTTSQEVVEFADADEHASLYWTKDRRGHRPMEIRFVATTTCLPADTSIEQAFKRIARKKFLNAVSKAHRESSFDVFLVDEIELDRDRESLDEMDLLGVYIPYHKDHHRPVIKISPEKIMKACMGLRGRSAPPLLVKTTYPAVFCAVVIHELAHFLMDDENHDFGCSWSRWADCFDEGRRTLGELLSRSSGRHFHHSSRPSRGRIASLLHVIEESLAEAFVLQQNFGEDASMIRDFIDGSPPAYRAGQNWKMDEKALGASAQSWSRFKQSLDRWSIAYLDSVQTPIDVLVNRLLNETVSDPIDFCGDFRIYLAVRLPAWQNDYNRMKMTGNTVDLENFLNGPFGVYWELTWQPKAADKKQRLALLRQWAANGSRDGVDGYQKMLSNDYVMQGEYALQ